MRTSLLVVAAVALLSAGCGGDSDDTSATPASPYEKYLADPPTWAPPGLDVADWVGMSEWDFMLAYVTFCDAGAGDTEAPEGSASRVIIEAFGGCEQRDEVFEQWVAEGLSEE